MLKDQFCQPQCLYHLLVYIFKRWTIKVCSYSRFCRQPRKVFWRSRAIVKKILQWFSFRKNSWPYHPSSSKYNFCGRSWRCTIAKTPDYWTQSLRGKKFSRSREIAKNLTQFYVKFRLKNSIKIAKAIIERVL